MTLIEIYNSKCSENSDIFQHLPALKEYSEKCETIIELGVRSIVSTWAFLASNPKSLISVDIVHPSKYLDYDENGCNLELVYKLADENNIDFKFIEHDSITVKLPNCDFMFFDTLHTYEQLSLEIRAHNKNVKKFMAFHDTETFASELCPAINEFLAENNNWEIEKVFSNNNGLTILKRKK